MQNILFFFILNFFIDKNQDITDNTDNNNDWKKSGKTLPKQQFCWFFVIYDYLIVLL